MPWRFEAGHEMRGLLDMADDGAGVVPGVEGVRAGRQLGNADLAQEAGGGGRSLLGGLQRDESFMLSPRSDCLD
jgi:hypothetical protein